jgi:hypothetical protein
MATGDNSSLSATLIARVRLRQRLKPADPPMPRPSRSATATLLLAVLSASLAPAEALDFTGTWQSRTTVRARGELDGSTTLRLRQYGRIVCGEWAESVGTGKLLGGNLTGRVDGRRMTVNIGEDIYWARSGKFPDQRHERALFALRGRELAWYVRDQRGHLLKQQVFERIEDTAAKADESFADPHFNRLCPNGVDFTAGN